MRLRKWRRACDTLDEGDACPPKPHCRLKADVVGEESSSYESTEDECGEATSTQSPLGESGDDDV